MILPNVPSLLVSPRLDAAMIQRLQILLDSKILWLERVYPLVYTGIDSEKKLSYPQLYNNDGSTKHFDLRPDNKVKAYSFFEVENPYKINVNEDTIEYYFSLIVWANLKLLNPLKTYDFSSELTKEVIDVLRFEGTNIFSVETRPEKIFDKYSGIKQELKQYLMNPYIAFKITFNIQGSYIDNC